MRVLIIGSGKNVHNELRQVDRNDFDLVVGVNQAAFDFNTEVLVTLHPREYADRFKGVVVSYVPLKSVNVCLDFKWPDISLRGGSASGSSGLYAVKYAMSIGATEIVLAGIGMDANPHYYGGGDWTECHRFREVWQAVAERLRGRVISLGGWTRELLTTGPTCDMLASENVCH